MMIYGKGGPFGKKIKRHIVPMTDRVKKVLELYFAVNDENGIDRTSKTLQRIVKRVANRAAITRNVTPHVLRHTFAVNCINKKNLDKSGAD